MAKALSEDWAEVGAIIDTKTQRIKTKREGVDNGKGHLRHT